VLYLKGLRYIYQFNVFLYMFLSIAGLSLLWMVIKGAGGPWKRKKAGGQRREDRALKGRQRLRWGWSCGLRDAWGMRLLLRVGTSPVAPCLPLTRRHFAAACHAEDAYNI
jgi:hypothetical protein